MDDEEVRISELYAMCDKVVVQYHIYGVECCFRAAIVAAIKENYIDEELLHDLVRGVYRLVRKEERDELSNK